jgi:hypothetical protein
MSSNMKTEKKVEFSEFDLRKLDLTRKYDEDFSPADGIQMREHVLLYMIGAFLVIMISWSAIATLDEVARGDGKVIPASEVQIIQSLEGGIIDAFQVKEGDEVQDRLSCGCATCRRGLILPPRRRNISASLPPQPACRRKRAASRLFFLMKS